MIGAILEDVVTLVIGIVVSLVITAAFALLFWFFWINQGVGVKFFSFLPLGYQKIGLWDTFCVFVALDVLKTVVFPSMSVKLKQNSK